MTRQLRVLDMFCSAGGASMGLRQAGFTVHGIDIERDRMKHYPFEFICGDALSLPVSYLQSFDLIWASPPCHFATAYKRRKGVCVDAVNLIPATRTLIAASGVPYIIENVEAREVRAEMVDPVMLCGSMFDMPIRRHRLFECSFPVRTPRCNHSIWERNAYPCAGNRSNPRKTMEIGVYRIPLADQRAAMGIDWMSLPELSLAIPPCYSKHLGDQAVTYLQARTL